MSVVVTLDKPGGRTASGSRFIREGTIALGTYATGGVAITKATFELAVDLSDLRVSPSAGYVAEFDKANSKVIVYQAGAHTHDLLLKDADQTDGASTRVNAAADKMGTNTGSSVTVTGQAAAASAHGGIIGVAAGALAEVANGTSLSAVNFRFRAEGH